MLATLNDIAAIPLGAAGFFIALWQIKKTKKAAEAASTAAFEARDTFGNGQALMLLQTLLRLEADLENAVHEGNHRLVTYQMNQWRLAAGQYRALLGSSPADKKTMRLIQDSNTAAALAKSQIMVPQCNLFTAASPALEKISLVTAEVGHRSMQTNMREG